ncbi:class I SAM-dependent methyltransferase [Marinactinospora thermotolerans]|uniref:Ubiquinone/menaquinone biosynthesis C-methylase UbiE n=1 Tax=Marinactinospora thermotolerans DSM 45154 TaxID=1122192 RepID=A0A1T4KC05_9ACTN|nr:class I SAM-dependent methyltransferase [Marinactinospora thermotolerans]SJZ39988.1 Ubiquinone/menaquinone biosynthesis C-methylase UbiE [Marinactinospora thermotolerans DSM 45154]
MEKTGRPDPLPPVTDWSGEQVAGGYERLTPSVEWVLGYPFVFRALGLERLRGGRLLDLGCGPGVVADHVARRFGVHVVAADVSPAMLSLARRRTGPLVEHHLVTDDQIPGLADASVDRAMCNFVLVCVPEKARILRLFREVHRLLRPEGRFAVLNPNPACIGTPFSTFMIGRKGERYSPGDPLPVRLRQTDGSWLDIVDTFWPLEVYEELLAEAGFGEIQRELPTPDDAHGVADPDLIAGHTWTAEHRIPPCALLTASL